MRDPFVNYDSWLEAPYQQMIDESDKFYEWCEENGYEDLDDPDQLKYAEEEYQAWLYDMAESWAESQYEAYCDRQYDEMMERGEW